MRRTIPHPLLHRGGDVGEEIDVGRRALGGEGPRGEAGRLCLDLVGAGHREHLGEICGSIGIIDRFRFALHAPEQGQQCFLCIWH